MGSSAKGRYIRSDGYVMLSDGKHGVYEHRVVAEQMLGRPLRPGELVHHANDDKADNGRGNLEVRSYTSHNQHHLGNKVSVHCGYCRRELEVSPSRIKRSKSGLVFCSTHCSGKCHNSKGVRGHPFDNSEDNVIRILRVSGIGWREIGRRLGRSHESIRTRAKVLGGIS